MKKQYTVVEEFTVKDAKVIVLNEERGFSNEKNLHFSVDGIEYPYSLTHNNRWLIVKSDDEFIGKTIYIN